MDHQVTDDSAALNRGLTILLELGGPVDLLVGGLNHRDVVAKARRLQHGVKNMPRGAQPTDDRRVTLNDAVTVAVRVSAVGGPGQGLVTVGHRKIKYTAQQRRALLSADLEMGRLPIVDDRGHTLHPATRKALEEKDLVVYALGADYYNLTEQGIAEARRLQDERRARPGR